MSRETGIGVVDAARALETKVDELSALASQALQRYEALEKAVRKYAAWQGDGIAHDLNELIEQVRNEVCGE